MSFSAHRPGRFGSDGRIEFETDGRPGEDLYLDDVRAQQAAGEPVELPLDADGPEDPFPVTRDLLEDALAMNPTQPVAVTESAEQARIGEWGAVDEPGPAAGAADPAAQEAGDGRRDQRQQRYGQQEIWIQAHVINP